MAKPAATFLIGGPLVFDAVVFSILIFLICFSAFLKKGDGLSIFPELLYK